MLTFMIEYYVQKFLLLKYYSKTTAFNEELPMKAIDYMKWALLFHMVVGAFMLTNSAIIADA